MTYQRWVSALAVALVAAVGCQSPPSADNDQQQDDVGVVDDVDDNGDVDNGDPTVGEQIASIAPGKLTMAGPNCGGPITGSGAATKSFTLFDDQGNPIGSDQLELEEEDVTFSDTAMFSFPDNECSSDDDCPDQLSCQPVGGGDDHRCQVEGDITVDGSVRFTGASAPDTQALMLAVADVGAWRGWYSEELAGYYEYDPDQQTVTGQQLSSTPVESLAVDPDGERGEALDRMFGEWTMLNEMVDDGERMAVLGVSTFGEAIGDVRSLIAETAEEAPTAWTWDTDWASDAMEEISLDSPSDRAGVYDSIVEIIEQSFDQAAVTGFDTADIVVVVPGHDETRGSVEDALDAVAFINSFGEVELSLSIIQVDAPRDVDEIPDDWAYYADQDPCTGDEDCKNFEACRQPAWYTDNADAASDADVVYPPEDQRGEMFCMPDYDENGRVGPIEDYYRIACEADGAYHYLPELSEQVLAEQLRGQVWDKEAGWSVRVRLREEGHSGAANQVQTVFEVGTGEDGAYNYTRGEDGDRRRVVFVRD